MMTRSPGKIAELQRRIEAERREKQTPMLGLTAKGLTGPDVTPKADPVEVARAIVKRLGGWTTLDPDDVAALNLPVGPQNPPPLISKAKAVIAQGGRVYFQPAPFRSEFISQDFPAAGVPTAPADEWGDWIPHTKGEDCPIPGAKGGEYMVRWHHGEEKAYKSVNADECAGWHHGSITAYRLKRTPTLLDQAIKPERSA